MTVDTRCRMVCDQGVMLSGSLSEDHIDTTNALAKVSGSIVFEGIKNLARGTVVNLAYQVPGYSQITRFPRRVRVLSCKADPLEGVTTVEVGCLLTLKQDLQATDVFYAADHLPAWQMAVSQYTTTPLPTPILAADVLAYALGKLGITAANGSTAPTSVFLRDQVDLSNGYISTINDLLMSENCYGFINAAERFVVRKVMRTGAAGLVLRKDDLLTMEGIESRSEVADEVEVVWNGSVEAAPGLKIPRIPILPRLPRSPGGGLSLTTAQQQKLNEVYANWTTDALVPVFSNSGGDVIYRPNFAKPYGVITQSEAKGIVYHAIRRRGPAPNNSNIISMSDARFDQLIADAHDFYYAYVVQRQAVLNVATGLNADGSKVA